MAVARCPCNFALSLWFVQKMHDKQEPLATKVTCLRPHVRDASMWLFQKTRQGPTSPERTTPRPTGCSLTNGAVLGEKHRAERVDRRFAAPAFEVAFLSSVFLGAP